MAWKVVNVIDGDTFEVSQNWRWRGKKGSLVRPRGYNAPERTDPGYQEAKDKLTKLILGKEVELGKAVSIDRGRLVCYVYYEGKSLDDYFPEYK